jgi:PKD repeat protein
VNQGTFTNGKEAYSPWITCDPETGALAVVFYDDRNTSSASCETWVAYSTDAGTTWTDFRVSDVSFTPNAIPGLASSYMGDYLGITGKGNVFYPCWTDTRNGLYMTYVSPFTLGLNAAFVANNTNVCTGSSVTFTNQSSGNPTSWVWSFPGGTPSSYNGANPPAITYSTPGTYNVSLTVSDGSTNDTELKTGYITVSNVIADFTGTPTTVVVGNTVTFTDNSSCSPTAWNWTFTGGTPSSATGPGPHVVTYNTIGTYNVSLTVTKAASTDTKTKTGYINVIAAVFNMTNGTITTCSGNFYDSGGSSGNYANNENFTETFYPATPGAKIRFAFSSFSTESGYDYLKIYDGINTSATLIGTYNGTTGPGTVTATNASGALTFNFTSDVSIVSSGWAASISCVGSAQPPVANFSASTTTPSVGQTVTFTDLSTNNPTSWSWSFSPATVTYVGGTSSTSQNPQVQFTAGGYYTVTLTATNAAGSDGETKTNYILATAPPVANFTASTTTPYIGQTVTFTDLSTNAPTSWAWSFSPATVTYVGGTNSASQNPQVQFNAGGLYSVTLTASNAGGSDGETKNNYISVLYAPVANFSANNTTPSIGQPVAFTDLSTNTPTSWSWSFNPATVTYVGGTNSTSQNPQVQFNASGSYSVTLIATNASGSDPETKTNYINVQGLPPTATLKLGSITNPAPGAVLVPVTLEAINNPVLGNNLISSWAWYIAYDASRLYNAAPSTPANLINYNAQFPQGNYVTNIIENHPISGWNTIAVSYASAYSGTGSVGMKFFDIVFTYTPGATVCPNLFWTSISIFETSLADDDGNEFILTLIDGCVWSEPPVADFMTSTTTPSTAETVNFTDLSTNYPTSWTWTFTPSTVTYIGGTTSTSQNPQVQFNAEGLYTVELTATNALGSDTETKTDYINVQSAIINLDVTVYLEGPFNGATMTPGINSILPLNQPYNVSPWNYTGTESVGSIPNGNIVDWILVELRDAASAASATSATMMDRQAAFLLNNGKVVGIDGSSTLQFNNSLTQQLFVVIWHRNHLGVMTSSFVTESGGNYTYNFSTGATQAYGSTAAHKQIGPGIWGMMGGDGNRDGGVTATDKIPLWEAQSGTQGYLESDYNLDSQSDNKDKDDIWAPNLGKGNQVPN